MMKLTQAGALLAGCGLASAATGSFASRRDTRLSRRWDYDVCLNDCTLRDVPIPDKDNFQFPLEDNWSEQCPPTFIGAWDAPTAVSKVCLGFSGPFVVFDFAPFPGYVTKTAKVSWKLMGNMLDSNHRDLPPPTAAVDCQPAPSGDHFVCKVPFADILQKPASTSTKDLLAGMCPNGDREGLGFYLAFSGTVSAPGSDQAIPFKQQYPCKPGARTTDRKCTQWDTNYDYFSISYRCSKCRVDPCPSCDNTISDSNNCGTCGNVCVTGSTCSSSACVCTNSGKPLCNGQCPDLTSDNNNCGTCGHLCASGTTCQSGACAALPGTCSTYTASCFDVMHDVLASNSIASPQLVDYRIQSAILGLTTPSDFLAALGPNPCHIFTDPTENSSCMELLANSQFVAQLTDIITGFLREFQACASDFATGGPDYQIVINEPNNATCQGHNRVRRHEKRTTFAAGEEYDLIRSMLEGGVGLGPRKSWGFPLLTRRQLSTCSQTGVCFQRCPDCRDRQTYCGSQANIITTTVCGALALAVNLGVAEVAGAGCGLVCAPLGPVAAAACAAVCIKVAPGLSTLAVGAACAELRSAICDLLTQRCDNCNSANSGICDADSTQCCAGETGTQCGVDCCCCPLCQAPGGINCECTAAPC